MNAPPPAQPKKYSTYELAAFAVTSGMFLLGLIANVIYLDWLFDSLFWLAGALLVYAERNDTKLPNLPTQAGLIPGKLRLFLCLYLLVDSTLLGLAALPYGGIVLVMYVVLAGLYGAACLLRLREQAIDVSRFGWQRLVRPPALLMTLAILVPLVCLYLPMLTVSRPTEMWSGPIVIGLPGTTHMSSGYTVQMGSTVRIHGCQAALGHLPLLLLAGLALLHLANTAGLVAASRIRLYGRVAVGTVIGWWVLVANGYGSLDNLANLLFMAGCGLLAVLLWLPQPAGETGTSPEQR